MRWRICPNWSEFTKTHTKNLYSICTLSNCFSGVVREVCESSVLLNLKKRFHRDSIYVSFISTQLWYKIVLVYSFCVFLQTYIGNMLLSINPFKPLNIYTDELRQTYQSKEQHRNPP